MAKPQLENGHTQIANEILEHLVKIHLSANQWQVLLYIIRKTYGFHKKVDYIANSQIVEATGLCKAVVSRSLHYLEENNLIQRKKKHIGFQKDWELWNKLAEQSTLATKLAEQSTFETPKKLAISTQELAESSTKVSSPAVAQKKKETIQKKVSLKNIYGNFKNVLLSGEEYQWLRDRFNNSTDERIEKLSEYVASVGKKYKSHYATILAWDRRDKEKQPKQDISTQWVKDNRYPNLGDEDE